MDRLPRDDRLRLFADLTQSVVSAEAALRTLTLCSHALYRAEGETNSVAELEDLLVCMATTLQEITHVHRQVAESLAGDEDTAVSDAVDRAG